MNRENVRTVVRVMLIALGRIAKTTRTQADDVMVAILQRNEEKLVDAVMQALGDANQPPTDEQIVAALESVGIYV